MNGVTEAKALAEAARLRRQQRLERESRLVEHVRKNPDVTAKDMAVLFRVPKDRAATLVKKARRTS